MRRAVPDQPAQPEKEPGSGERLFVSNLPKHATEQELLQIFGSFGQVFTRT